MLNSWCCRVFGRTFCYRQPASILMAGFSRCSHFCHFCCAHAHASKLSIELDGNHPIEEPPLHCISSLLACSAPGYVAPAFGNPSEGPFVSAETSQNDSRKDPLWSPCLSRSSWVECKTSTTAKEGSESKVAAQNQISRKARSP